MVIVSDRVAVCSYVSVTVSVKLYVPEVRYWCASVISSIGLLELVISNGVPTPQFIV